MNLCSETVPDLFEAARQETAKRAKTKETTPTTPAKSKQHQRAETPSKVWFLFFLVFYFCVKSFRTRLTFILCFSRIYILKNYTKVRRNSNLLDKDSWRTKRMLKRSKRKSNELGQLQRSLQVESSRITEHPQRPSTIRCAIFVHFQTYLSVFAILGHQTHPAPSATD